MLVYLDTNIWIYAYENDPTFGSDSEHLMQKLRTGRHRIAASLFVLNELLVLPARNADTFTVASYRRLFASENLELLPYTIASAQTYAQLRAFDRVKPLDALHLATASTAGVDLFVTHDTRLLPLAVPGIGAVVDTSVRLNN